MPTTYTHAIHIPSGGTGRAVAVADAAYDDLSAFTVALLVRFDASWDGIVCGKGVLGTSGWHLNEASTTAFDMVQQRATTQDFQRDGGYPGDNAWHWLFIAEDRATHLYTRAAGPFGGTIADVHRGLAATGAGTVVAEAGGFRIGGDDTHFSSGVAEYRFAGIASSVLTLVQMQAIASDAVGQAALFVDYWKPAVGDTTQVSGAKATLPALVYSNGASLVSAPSLPTTEVVMYPFADFKAVIGDNFYCLAEALANTGTTSADAVAWTSSATGVATINSSTGQYTPVANGTTTITATAGSVTATRTMTVVTSAVGVPIGSAVTRAIWTSRINALSSPGTVKIVDTDYAGNLQNALNAAAASGTGWTLKLTAGAEYGNVVLPANTGSLITITTTGSIPPRGTRATAAVAATYNLPRIWSRNTVAAVSTNATLRTQNYRFLGVDIGLAVGDTNKLANYGAFYMATASRLSLFPQDIYCDRVFFRGRASAYQSRFGWGVEGAWCAAIDCVATEHHFATGTPEGYASGGEANSDSQGMRTINGPGPIYAENCEWQSSHECVGIGGGDNPITNLLIRDVRLYRCDLNRPLAWKGVYTCKNLFEVKHGLFVEAEDCVYSRSWVDQQTGHCFMVWAVNQGGGSPETATRDVWIHGGVVLQASKLLTIADRQSNFTSALMHRLTLENIACIGMDSSPDTLQPNTNAHSAGTIMGFGASDVGSKNVTLRHITITGPFGWGFSWDSSSTGKTWDGLVIEDCILGGHPLFISDAGTGSAVWTTKKGTNARFRNNIGIEYNGIGEPSGGSDTNNTYLTSVTSDVFVTPSLAFDPAATLPDLAVPAGSPYLGTTRGGTYVTTDGADPGADMVALALMYAIVVPAGSVAESWVLPFLFKSALTRAPVVSGAADLVKVGHRVTD